VIVLVVVLVQLVVFIVELAAFWRIFTKAGERGWAAIVPVYNLIVLQRVVGRPAWWVFLWFVPGASAVVAVIVLVELAEVFGRSGWFSVGLIALTPIFAPILGLGRSRYNARPT
jgi:hypothetical protein